MALVPRWWNGCKSTVLFSVGLSLIMDVACMSEVLGRWDFLGVLMRRSRFQVTHIH